MRYKIKIFDFKIACYIAGLLILGNVQSSMATDFDVPSASYATVQAAIDGALSEPTPAGETHRIRVAQGTYYENINISPSGYDVSFRLDIQGGWTSDFSIRVEDPTLTVLDGSSNGSVMIVNGAIFGPNITLAINGFTIQNGDADDQGGGIDIHSSAWYGNTEITVENNIIRNNKAVSFGGGLYVSLAASNDHTAAIFVNNNDIHNNVAEVMGGGVYTSLNIFDQDSVVFASLAGNEIASNITTQDKAFNYIGGQGGGLFITTRETAYAIVNSNTIRHNESADTTGGVYILTNDESSISFSSNTVRGNKAAEGTGGLSASAWGDSSLAVENNLLTENMSIDRGGASIHATDREHLYFKHNYVFSNEAGKSTGGFSALAKDDGLIDIVNNLVAFNQALDGTSGGASISAWANGRINYYNNTVADNYASSNWGGSNFNAKDSTAAIIAANNIFWGNTTDDPTDDSVYLSGEIANIQLLYSNYYSISPTTGWDGAGNPSNISVDPLFADGPLGYHYLSQTAAGQVSDSPCRDTGDGFPTDYGLENRVTRTDQVIDSAMVDMGFHYPVKTEEGKPGDADGDGDVDGSDISGFARAFLSGPDDVNYVEAYDLDENPGISEADLSVFVVYFGGWH